jgi:hypothetical protein
MADNCAIGLSNLRRDFAKTKADKGVLMDARSTIQRILQKNLQQKNM